MRLIIKQFITFSSIGVINTALDFSVYVILNRFFGIYYLLANRFAFIVSVSSSFLMNRSWTYKCNDKINFSQYSKFIFFSILTLVVVEIIMYFGVSHFQINDLVVKLVVTSISVLMNFSFSKFLVFKK